MLEKSEEKCWTEVWEKNLLGWSAGTERGGEVFGKSVV